MKIAMVSVHASPLATQGRQNLHVADLSAAFCEQGHDVRVYTRREDPGLPDRVRTDHGYEVVHVPAGPAKKLVQDMIFPYMGDFARFLGAEWADDAPDVAHAHHWTSGLATVLSARGTRIPVVQTYHALGVVERQYEDTSPDERIAVERLIGREAAHVVAACEDEVRELVRMGLHRAQISVVPSGVDTRLFTLNGPSADRQHMSRVVAAGRLAPRSGFADIITALPTVTCAELVIAGGPVKERLSGDPEYQRLRALACDLGVANRVTFVGRVTRPEMPALLRSADVVACVPWHASSGVVPLEAMACGIPVVASTTESVVDGVTGLHVPPREPIALGRALRALLADDTLRQEFSAAGHDRVCARYSWDRVAGDVLRVYEQVAGPVIGKPPDVTAQPG